MKDKVVKFVRLLIVIICILLVISLVQNISRSRQMQQTLANAEASLNELKNRQTNLQQDLSIIESDFYLEKEARNKLGLVKEGEVVIVLPDEELLRRLSPRKEQQENIAALKPNWRKWLELFI